MIKINLQLFGGRGSGGGNNPGSSRDRRIAEVSNDKKVQAVIAAANKNWQSGSAYGEPGMEEEYEIGYTVDEYYNIYQTSDGHVYNDARVQRMVEGEDSGRYQAWNQNEELLVTSSAAKAAKWAWGTPKEFGYKKIKR